MTTESPAARIRRSAFLQQPRGSAILLILIMLMLVACQGDSPEESAVESPRQAAPVQDAAIQASEIETVDPGEAAAPVQLQIPDIGLEVPVTPMAWRVVTVDGERTTSWDVPLDSIGWHVNSAGAGAAGNVLLSGRQADGEALLEPLALGSVAPGQEVILTDENGLAFVYRIREVSEPLPVSGATDDENARAQAFVTPTDEAILTLISGWPEFTTTHRIFAVAELVGMAE